MAQRTGGRGDTIRRSAELLEAMRLCRRRLIEASIDVRPFGSAYNAIHMVTAAIDTLAFFITGRQHFYAITGSAPLGPQQMPPTARSAIARPDDADEPE